MLDHYFSVGFSFSFHQLHMFLICAHMAMAANSDILFLCAAIFFSEEIWNIYTWMCRKPAWLTLQIWFKTKKKKQTMCRLPNVIIDSIRAIYAKYYHLSYIMVLFAAKPQKKKQHLFWSGAISPSMKFILVIQSLPTRLKPKTSLMVGFLCVSFDLAPLTMITIYF